MDSTIMMAFLDELDLIEKNAFLGGLAAKAGKGLKGIGKGLGEMAATEGAKKAWDAGHKEEPASPRVPAMKGSLDAPGGVTY